MTRRTFFAVATLLVAVVALQPADDAIGGLKHKAGLVIRSADGDVDEMCVFFDEPTISGLDLLNRAGVNHVSEKSAVGSAICGIDGTGCKSPSEKCFCEFPTFWGYWVRDPDEAAWKFSSVGAADREVSDGSIDGWSWGKDGKPAPPKLAFNDVCAASNVVTAAPTTQTAPVAATPERVARPNYAAFGAFALLFALLAGGAVLLRRRGRTV